MSNPPLVECSGGFKIIFSDELKGHGSFVWSILSFPLFHRVVSCSLDKTIRIWNTKSGKCEIIFKIGGGYNVRHIIKWNEKIFLGCKSGDIVSYSVESQSRIGIVYTSSGMVGGFCKVGNRLLVLHGSMDERKMTVVDFLRNENKDLQSLFKIVIGPSFAVSQVYENSVIAISEYGGYFQLNLVDYVNDRVIRDFTCMKEEESLLTVACYKQSSCEELVITGGYEGNLYIFRNWSTSEQKYSSVLVKKVFVGEGGISSCFVAGLSRKILCLGTIEGSFVVLDFENLGEILVKKKSAYENIYHMEIYEEKEGCVVFYSSRVKLSRTILTYDVEDSGRRKFMMELIDGKNSDGGRIFFSLKLLNVNFLVFRSLF